MHRIVSQSINNSSCLNKDSWVLKNQLVSWNFQTQWSSSSTRLCVIFLTLLILSVLSNSVSCFLINYFKWLLKNIYCYENEHLYLNQSLYTCCFQKQPWLVLPLVQVFAWVLIGLPLLYWQNIKVGITLVWGVCFAFFVLKTAQWQVNLKTEAFLKRNVFWQRTDSNGLDINHTFCFKLWNLELNMTCHYTATKQTFLQAHTILFFLIILSTEDLFGLFFQWASSTAFHLKLLCTIPCKLFLQHTRKWHPKRTGYFQLYGPNLYL